MARSIKLVHQKAFLASGGRASGLFGHCMAATVGLLTWTMHKEVPCVLYVGRLSHIVFCKET